MLIYFKTIGVNTNIHKFCCKNCYKYLNKLSAQKKLYESTNIFIKKNKRIAEFIANATNADSFVSNVFELMSDEGCYSNTDLHKNQFNELFVLLNQFEWNFSISLKDSLGFYLARLRLGLSIYKLMNIFRFAKYSTLCKLVEKIRDLLSKYFVIHNLGFDHINRGLY